MNILASRNHTRFSNPPLQSLLTLNSLRHIINYKVLKHMINKYLNVEV